MASAGTFLRYPFLQTFKNTRRTFSAIIGVTLAVTLVAAENISIDSSSRAFMDSLMESMPVDILARTSGTADYAAVARSLARVGLVTDVEPVSGYQFAALARSASNASATFPVNLSGVEPSFAEKASRFGFSGDFRLSPGGIVISESLSAATGAVAGQKLRLEMSVLKGYNGSSQKPVYQNNTIELSVSAVISHEHVPASYDILSEAPSMYNPQGRENPATRGEMGRYFGKDSAAFVLLGELGEIAARLSEGSDRYTLNNLDEHFNRTFHYCIWTQRYSLLNAFEPDGSRRAISNLGSRLILAGDEFQATIEENNLASVLDTMSNSFRDARTKYLAFSLPVIFLGLYLGMLGVDMGMSERRREAALLKSRGATGSHLLRLFLVEGVFLGMLAGGLGLLTGALASTALFSFIVPGTSGLPPGLYLTPYSAGLSIFLGVFLMLLAMYLPARRAARVTITEGLAYYSTEEAAEKYNPRNALAMTSLSAIFYLSITLFDPQRWTDEGRALDIAYIILFALRGLGSVFSWLLPLMLIFGVTGLLTRASFRPYAFLARLTRPMTGELWPVVDRNLVRNPRRASRVCVIIAISLTFGILVTTWAATEEAHQRALSRAVVGADVRAVIAYPAAAEPSLAGRMAALPHAADSALAYSIDQASIASGGVDLFALQAKNYSRVAFLDERLFLEGSSRDVASLAGGKRLIINQALQSQSSAGADDTVLLKISVRGTGQALQLSCRIVAVVKALPGMLGEVFGGAVQNPLPAAYIDVGNLDISTVVVSHATVFVDSGSPGKAAEEIKAAVPGLRPGQVLVEEQYLEDLRGGPASISDYRFLLLESAFAVVIVTAGLGLILTAAVYERRKETAGWMARGATRRQVASIFVAEALTLLALALAVGTVTGFLTSYMALGLFGTGAADPVGRSLVMSYDTLWLIIATVASLLFTSYAVSWKAGRVDLAQVLRLRGG